MHFGFKPHFGRHLGSAFAQDSGSKLVARLIDQRAGEVLALANDHALGKCRFDERLIGIFHGSYCERLNAQVLAVAAVGIGVKVGYERAFHGGTGTGRFR